MPVYDRMIVMDGNNSLKRLASVGGRQVGDARTFNSDYILPRSFVNQFAHEVKGRPVHVAVPEPGDTDPADYTAPDDVVEGDPTDGAPEDSPCATNWKAAAADEKKKMWAIFEETGIFACACCHGFILLITDMVRSSEL